MTVPGRDPLLWRFERDSFVVALVLAVVAAGLWPARPARALGVLGGFGLIAVGYRGIRAGVDGLWAASAGLDRPEAGSQPASSPPRAGFVKFFTRNAILAVGAYVMMARFEFDPIAMLVGVTTPAVAATLELMRTVRARRRGSNSRSS